MSKITRTPVSIFNLFIRPRRGLRFIVSPNEDVAENYSFPY